MGNRNSNINTNTNTNPTTIIKKKIIDPKYWHSVASCTFDRSGTYLAAGYASGAAAAHCIASRTLACAWTPPPVNDHYQHQHPHPHPHQHLQSSDGRHVVGNDDMNTNDIDNNNTAIDDGIEKVNDDNDEEMEVEEKEEKEENEEKEEEKKKEEKE